MNLKSLTVAGIGVVTLTTATLTMTLTSNAQEPEGQGPGAPPAAGPRGVQGGPPGLPGQPPFPGQPGQGQPGQFRPGAGMAMGGGGTAMDSDNAFLYIVQGNMLFKVAKADLRVVGTTPLMQMRQDFGPAQPLQERRGGGNVPPPPPNE